MACRTNSNVTNSGEAVRVSDALTNAKAAADSAAALECVRSADPACVFVAEVKPAEIIVRYFSRQVTNPYSGQILTNHLIEVVYTGTYSCFTSRSAATGAALADACGVNFDVNVETLDPGHPVNAAAADADAKAIATAICAAMPAGCTVPTMIQGSVVDTKGVWKSVWACTKPVAGGAKTPGGSGTVKGSDKKPKKSTTPKKPKKSTTRKKPKKSRSGTKPKTATTSAKRKKSKKAKKPVKGRRARR